MSDWLIGEKFLERGVNNRRLYRTKLDLLNLSQKVIMLVALALTLTLATGQRLSAVHSLSSEDVIF